VTEAMDEQPPQRAVMLRVVPAGAVMGGAGGADDPFAEVPV
jgi:hypothetical protein